MKANWATNPEATEAPRKLKHAMNSRFDVLRGGSAIVVLIAHTTQCFIWSFFSQNSRVEMTFGWAARFAVLIFFLLSGRLIAASIARNIHQNGRFDSRDYLLSRIARLYPPLLFAIAIVVLVVTAIDLAGLPGANGSPLGTLRATGLSFTSSEVIQSALLYDGLTTANGPLWTLYIEAKLYIGAGGVAMLIFGRSAFAALTGVLLLGFAVWSGLDHYRFWFFAAVWIYGALTSLAAAGRPLNFLILSAIFLMTCRFLPHQWDYLDNRTGTMIQAVGCVFVAYTVLVRDWAEVEFPKWMLDTSRFSYTLYVVHFPILALGLAISLRIYDTSFAFAIVAGTLSASTALVIAIIAAHYLENTAANKRLLRRWLAIDR